MTDEDSIEIIEHCVTIYVRLGSQGFNRKVVCFICTVIGIIIVLSISL